jgi:hypothetical protein
MDGRATVRTENEANCASFARGAGGLWRIAADALRGSRYETMRGRREVQQIGGRRYAKNEN